jgi:hypothetical protein
MRRLLISTAILAFVLCSVQAQDLDQLLKDHYKASGQEQMTKIKTIITKGKIAYVAAGMETAITMYQARPNKLRLEADLMGSKVIQTYNGTSGWIYAPAMGLISPQEMGPDEIKVVLQQAQFESPLWNYKAKGSRVELAGSSEDGSAYKVKMTQSDGETMTLLIDKKTFLISGITSVQVMGGAETEVNISMKDYKAVKGIQSAHYLATKINGEIMVSMTVASIEFDKEIDPALFEKPATE